MSNPLAGDLEQVLLQTRALWDGLREGRLFVTGGTGFFGCWLLESFLWANDRLGLKARAVVLTRDAEAFRRKAPHLASHPAITLHPGDVRTFAFPAGTFTHVIHAAADASSALIDEQPCLMFDTIADGTRRALNFARAAGARPFLMVSSGAVYGRQPSDLNCTPEEFNGGPNVTSHRSAYGEGKRAAEWLCAAYAREGGIEPKIARCYAFVGPYLPLDRHFAVGNFIRDGLQGRRIAVTGDGTPFRSYLYAADLAVWLWTILLQGRPGRPYNVGSERAVNIAGLAAAVGAAFQPPPEVSIAGTPAPGQPAERYVPSTRRAREELGLRETVELWDAIGRTVRWHRKTD